MRIGIVGSGQVAQKLGGKLASAGHEVKLGTRDPEKLREWISSVKGAASAGFAEAAAKHGEVVLKPLEIVITGCPGLEGRRWRRGHGEGHEQEKEDGQRSLH